MLFDMSLTSRKKVNKALSRAENNLLWKLIQPAESILSGLAYMLPNLESTDDENHGGVLCILCNEAVKSYEVQFLSTIQQKSLFKLIISPDVKVERPRPNLLVIHSVGVHVFKFINLDDSKALCSLLTLKICHTKRSAFARSLTKDDIGLPTDFRSLNVGAWNTIRQLQEQETIPKLEKNSRWKSTNLRKSNKPSSIERTETSRRPKSTIFHSISDAVRRVSVKKDNKPEKKFKENENIESNDDQAPLLTF